MVNVTKDWKSNVKAYVNDPAIRWKASQRKDRKKIRSENSEDALTWQVFRTLEATGQLDKWVKDSFGLEDCFVPYYWQRRFDSSETDRDIAVALSAVEPYHEKHSRQHTETDLILRGKRHLVMCEMKLGYRRVAIKGWRQAEKSPIVDDYQPHASLFVIEKENWRKSMKRFAQLYKNLILGNVLSKSWWTDPRQAPSASDGKEPDVAQSSLALHLLVVVNGATKYPMLDGTYHTYELEFGEFCKSCCAEKSRLHFTTWQNIREWVKSHPEGDLSFVRSRLLEHPLL